ncbi:hypothetical protein [Paraburkholderia azotifigens]|uniref:Uncharacterized protein n=1 Tax=Paraburkholderia azotifigens TaxID=2057004 RepID=A0A5C6VYE5_9BURK|nr:hypothetical protein [Paraburkholderia azotifigens]TXC88488.1 hypothetical protein FRZ40_13335 [Paraburkholderia azotifigens]
MMAHSHASWADTTEIFQVARATSGETHGGTVGMPMVKRTGVEHNARALTVDESAVVRIREALIFAARAQQVVSYRDFHAFFGGAGTLRKRFELLDRIVHELADPADADYGSLMANSQGLPGPEFLRRYRVFHADEYETIVGGNAFTRPRSAQRLRIALTERQRVYLHARNQRPALPEVPVWTPTLAIRGPESPTKP